MSHKKLGLLISLVIAIKLDALSIFRAVTTFLFHIIQSVTEKYGQTFGTVPVTKTREIISV
jgi:hypothetical protein